MVVILATWEPEIMVRGQSGQKFSKISISTNNSAVVCTCTPSYEKDQVGGSRSEATLGKQQETLSEK
jgi:hypothetical protein